jgi:hypothetical protein
MPIGSGISVCVQEYAATWQKSFDDCASRNMKLAILNSQSMPFIFTGANNAYPGNGAKVWVDGQNSPSCQAVVKINGVSFESQTVACSALIYSLCQL